MSFGITNAKAKMSNGSAFYETTTDATLNNGVYELALSNLSDTPKVNDYVAFVENVKVINVYKVNSVDTTKACMERVYNGANCLMTKTITLDGTEEGWTYYKHESQGWTRWGNLDIPADFPIPSSYSTKPKARSKTFKVGSIYELQTEAYGNDANVFAVSNVWCIRPKSSVAPTINTLEEFKAWLHDNPITVEYLLTESNWGGLH